MSPRNPAPLQAWLAAGTTLLACLAVGLVLENYFHPANLVMVFLAGVAYVSARHPLPVAVATVLASLLAYDLIFIEPRWSLKPIDPQNWVALVVMLGVGLLISRLAAHGREQAALAMERAQFEKRSHEAALETERERLRNTLLAGISHDFRTPLTTIMGNATTLLLQGSLLDEARRRALLEDLLSEARLLSTTTSNLLELTRMEEGAVRVAAEWCHADELVEEALSALRLRLAPHRVEVSVDDQALVWCDPTLVAMVLHNLLDNAARHTPAGGCIRVAVELRAGQWCLRVRDEGPGVAPEHRQSVFKKFHRLREDGTAAGRGLGLAICAAVARLHGGSIELVPQEAGDGACFLMTLPQPEPPAQPAWPEGEPS